MSSAKFWLTVAVSLAVGFAAGWMGGSAGKRPITKEEARLAPDRVEKYLAEPKGLAGAFTKGPKNAKVSILEISDFQCPFCKRGHATMSELMKQFGDKISVTFINLPLSFHKRAAPAAHAAMAAGLQGKFFEYHDLLFENNTALEDADLEKYAKDLGLDMEKWKKDKDSKETADLVARQAKLANALGLTGTPGFFVNGEEVKGAKPIEEFAPIIETHLAKVDGLVAKGVPVEKIHAALSRGSLGGSYYKYVFEGATPPEPAAEKEPDPPLGAKAFDIPVGDSGRLGEGNEIVIANFSDFQCPFSKKSVEYLDEVLNHYGRKRASIVFKQFPLSFHKQAALAAEASLAAAAQNKFEEMYRKMFDNQQALTRTDLEAYAQQIGLNMKRFKDDLDNGTWKKAVEEDMVLAKKVGVGGTPTIFVNGRLYGGDRTMDGMVQIIDSKILGVATAAPAPAAN